MTLMHLGLHVCAKANSTFYAKLLLQWVIYFMTLNFKTTLIMKPLNLVPKWAFWVPVLLNLHFKTTCHIRQHFQGPIGGLKIEGPLHSSSNLQVTFCVTFPKLSLWQWDGEWPASGLLLPLVQCCGCSPMAVPWNIKKTWTFTVEIEGKLPEFL